MKALHLPFLVFILVCSSCAMLAKASSTAGGAAVGSAVAGPPGAAIGAASGYVSAELFGPEELKVFEAVEPPEDIWSLLGLVVDKAFWLVVIAGIAYLFALMLPPPNRWTIWKRLAAAWKDRRK